MILSSEFCEVTHQSRLLTSPMGKNLIEIVRLLRGACPTILYHVFYGAGNRLLSILYRLLEILHYEMDGRSMGIYPISAICLERNNLTSA